MSSNTSFPEQGVEILVNLGMPRQIAVSIRDSEGFTPRMTAFTGLVTLIVLLAMIAAAVWFIGTLPAPQVWILLGLIPADTQLIDVETSFAVASIFVAICTTGIITNLIAASRRDLAIRSAVTSIQKYLTRSPKWSLRFFPGGTIRHLDPSLPRDDYLAAFPLADAWFAVRATAVFSLLMILCFLWDGSSATCATPDGVLVGSRLSLTRRLVAWDTIQNLSTGCYRSGNGTIRHRIWKLHLPDGTIVDFNDSAVMDGSRSNLNALSQVDEILRRHNVPWRPSTFEGGPSEGQLQWDEQCFDSILSNLSDGDQKTFRRVYHLDDFNSR